MSVFIVGVNGLLKENFVNFGHFPTSLFGELCVYVCIVSFLQWNIGHFSTDFVFFNYVFFKENLCSHAFRKSLTALKRLVD